MTSGTLQHDLMMVARKEFVECGYGAASIRSIAQKAGVSLSAMYYHYTNKQGLLAAMIDVGMDSFMAGLRAALDAAESTPTAQLDAYIGALVRFRSEELYQSRLVETEVRNLEPEHLEAYTRRRREASAPLREIVAAGVAGGEFLTPFPDDSYRTILGMCNAISTWYDPEGGVPVDEIVTRYQELARRVVYHRDTVPPTPEPELAPADA